MGDGEVELSDHILVSNPDCSSNIHVSTSMDSYLDEFLKKNNRTCTHTHTCNPPGPGETHTHTCYHTHTQVLQPEEGDVTIARDGIVSTLKMKRPLGNREAVRKYREKKKAHTAYLEEEVKKLQDLNQQLVKKLQGQAILEAEVLRLRGLLLDLRGKIDNELGVSTFQTQCNTSTSFKEGDCGAFFTTNHGGNVKKSVASKGNCEAIISDCRVNGMEMHSSELCAIENVESLVNSSSQAE